MYFLLKISFLFLFLNIISCTECSSDSDCSYYYNCISSQCVHKDLFPASIGEILPMFLIFCTSIITTVGGVGGGIFFFPILMIFYNLAPTEAIASSLTAVAGVLTTRYLMSIDERQVRRDKPIIDYDIAIVFCPSVISGTIFGVLVNRFSPNWFVLLLISVAMSIVFLQTWKKAKEHKNNEINNKKNNRNLSEAEKNRLIRMEKMILKEGIEETKDEIEKIELIELKERKGGEVPYSSLEEDVIYIDASPYVPIKQSAQLMEKILKEESRLIPYKKLGILIINLLCLIFILLIQGSKFSKSIVGVEYCSPSYWILQFIYIPIGFLVLFYNINMLSIEYEEKVKAGYLFLKTDIKWDKESAIKSVIIGYLTGATSAILGVGGSLIAGPVLLGMGYSPQEATYTSTFISVFTAIAGFVQYVMAGLIRYDYGLMCLLIGICGLYVGMKYCLVYIKKNNKGSLIVYSLAITVGISTLITVYWGILKSIDEFNEGKMLTLKKVC